MPSEEEIKKAILEGVYESSDSLISANIVRSLVIEGITGRFDDIDETDVQYQLTTLEEDRLVKRDGSTIQMGKRGLEKYEELGGETNLDEELQEDLLEILLEEKQSDPRHPYVAKDELIDRLGESEDVVTENVWLQHEMGNVELRQAIGSDYEAVAITSLGRRVLE